MKLDKFFELIHFCLLGAKIFKILPAAQKRKIFGLRIFQNSQNFRLLRTKGRFLDPNPTDIALNPPKYHDNLPKSRLIH